MDKRWSRMYQAQARFATLCGLAVIPVLPRASWMIGAAALFTGAMTLLGEADADARWRVVAIMAGVFGGACLVALASMHFLVELAALAVLVGVATALLPPLET